MTAFLGVPLSHSDPNREMRPFLAVGAGRGLEDLTDSVLYDVFYESTTMLAGRMLAQQRLRARSYQVTRARYSSAGNPAQAKPASCI